MPPTKNSTGKTLNDLAEASCRNFGQRPALSLAFHRPISYGELFDRILRIAAVLKNS
ncbi:MAG: hypothetical protein HY789_02505, partial [Deltaproteobacteria bacterium]|nr:hypothetical protein [Deltaproteobacteria bacterium]